MTDIEADKPLVTEAAVSAADLSGAGSQPVPSPAVHESSVKE